MTLESLLAGWGGETGVAASGRHVLAIQDTSEFTFRTTPERRRGLGEIGKGVGRGVILHAMLALDAGTGACLGLVAGQVWTRSGRTTIPHAKRPLVDKESHRWLASAERAKTVLGAAAIVTVVADRESDIYDEWARLPEPAFHLLTRVMQDLLTRVMQDRCLVGGGRLFAASELWPVAARERVDLPARAPHRPARQAEVSLRFGPVTLKRPRSSPRHLPPGVTLTLVEVVETPAPGTAEPVHWRLLTTHDVTDASTAWRIVEWYKARWTIEQLFRLMKRQGLRLEDSQLEDAERLVKLTAIAAKAAAVTLQLVQARDGHSAEPASVAFAEEQIAALEALGPTLEGRTSLQKNPHPRRSLAWATWIIGRLGGWDGYPSSKPPGPITLRYGLEYFHAFAAGRQSSDLCMP